MLNFFAIFILKSILNFMLSRVEDEKSFLTSDLDLFLSFTVFSVSEEKIVMG